MKAANVKAIVAAAALAVAGGAAAQESSLQLADGPGKDKAAVCVACHSIDYIPMNSRFMDKARWTATVNKMINAFGAPIAKDDVDVIAAYLTHYYGVEDKK